MMLLARVFCHILLGRTREFLSCLGGPCCLEAEGKLADLCESLSHGHKAETSGISSGVHRLPCRRCMDPVQGIHELGLG